MVVALGLVLGSVSRVALGFSVGGMNAKSMQLSMATSLQDEGDSRRSFFSKAAGIAAVGLGCPFLPLDVANAVTGTGKVNAKLKGSVFDLS